MPKYNMAVKKEEIRDIINGTSNASVSYQFAVITGVEAMLTAFLCLIFRLFVNPFSLLTLLVFLSFVAVFAVFFIVGIITGETEGQASRFVMCILLMGYIPAIWFLSGGFSGMGAIWFLFGSAFLAIALNRDQFFLLLPIHIAIFFVTVMTTVFCPELIKYETDFQMKAGIVASVVIVSSCVVNIIRLQVKAADIDRKRVAELQADLSATNEELTAQNEELMAMNEEIMNMTEKLQDAMERQRLFTASMTHELRSPMNGIEGCLQMMLMSGTLDDENKASLENALKATRNLTRTINDMLDFAKLSEGKFEIIERDFDLREVVDNVHYIFSEQIKAKGLEYKVEAPDDMPCMLAGDDGRIQQVMTNLVSNSVKYTPEGTVKFSLDVRDNILFFEVSDTGLGMSEESIATLFDPFTRFDLKKNSGIQGTGLGMNIVANLVKAMNGEIRVESELGKGTTFFVKIPVLVRESSVRFGQKVAKTSEVVFTDADFTGKKILCVDDTKLNLVIFKGLLKKTGAIVDTVTSGYEALEITKDTKYDIIFMDHQMPGMDGIKTYHKILESDNVNRETPVVMLTGNAGEEYGEVYAKESFADYLLKPIDQNKLMGVLTKYC